MSAWASHIAYAYHFVLCCFRFDANEVNVAHPSWSTLILNLLIFSLWRLCPWNRQGKSLGLTTWQATGQSTVRRRNQDVWQLNRALSRKCMLISITFAVRDASASVLYWTVSDNLVAWTNLCRLNIDSNMNTPTIIQSGGIGICVIVPTCRLRD